MYAVALRNVLGRGDFIAVAEENEPEYFSHVALKVDGKIYDATGQITKSELRSYGHNDEYPRQKIELVSIDEDGALKYTGSMFGEETSVEEIEKLIRKKQKVETK
jgi:hypothetical protein